MTIQDAERDGITKIRKPYWNPTAFLVLPPKVEGGHFGPWCELHDVGTVQEILITEAEDGLSDWEAGPVDPPTPATKGK